MSCAVFTVIGIVVLKFNISNHWALWVTAAGALAMLVLAPYPVWRDAYNKNLQLLAQVAELRHEGPHIGLIFSEVPTS